MSKTQRKQPRSQSSPSRRGALARASRLLGSLQMAVVLLPLFAAALFLGTLVESWYDGKVARQLVYGTWWFATLLALLGVTIFFAAVKKWPWQKHQTGFLITHVGLLCLVTGGIVNSLSGVSAMMVMVDSDSITAQSYGRHQSNLLIDRNVHSIQLQRLGQRATDLVSIDFRPGVTAWRADDDFRPTVDPFAQLLNAIAHPFPRHWAYNLDAETRLEILNYYPHAQSELFGPDKQHLATSFPAIQFQLSSPTFGSLPRRWTAYHDGSRAIRLGSGLIETLASNCRPEQIREFQNPPRATSADDVQDTLAVEYQGQLVVGLENQTYRFDIASSLGQPPQRLGKTAWHFELTGVQRGLEQAGDAAVGANPSVTFRLKSDEGAYDYVTHARFPQWQTMTSSPNQNRSADAPQVWTWYHAPDHRYADASVKGVLQFVTDHDGQLYYRTFSGTESSDFGFEQAGKVDDEESQLSIWKRKNWTLRISQFVPNAQPGPFFVPVNRRVGLEDDRTPPAIRCRLSTSQGHKEFWLAKRDGEFDTVAVGDEGFLVGYNSKLLDLEFELTLLRAEQTLDRGSTQPASQSSYVLLDDSALRIERQSRLITLNNPLSHRGYKIFQSNYRSLGIDENSRPISQAVLIVARDPGVRLKYAGSVMLAIGITCMFYMRAYFFKPRTETSQPRAVPVGEATT